MAGTIVLEPSTVQVAPGGESVCTVRIRNTGAVVDAFTISVLGDAAAWTTVAPPTVSLFPGADGTATLHFRPPRSSEVLAGPMPFGVRAVPSEDAEGATVEEGELRVLPFVELSGRITPRTSEAKRSAKHLVVIENRGNAEVSVDLSALDPDEQLVFDIRPPELPVPGGGVAEASVKVAARSGFLTGPDKHRPFQVSAVAAGQPPVTLDATLVQRAGLPRFIVPLIVAAAALGAFLLILPTFQKEDEGPPATIPGASVGPTTTAAAGTEGDEPGAPPDQGGEQAGGGDGGATPPPTEAPTTVPPTTTTEATAPSETFTGNWAADGSHLTALFVTPNADRTSFRITVTNSVCGQATATATRRALDSGTFAITYAAGQCTEETDTFRLVDDTTVAVAFTSACPCYVGGTRTGEHTMKRR